MTPPRTRTRYLRYALRTTSILLSFPRSRTLSSGTLRVVPSNGKRAYHRAFYAKGLTHGSRSQRTPDVPAVSLHNPTSPSTASGIIPIKQDRPFPSGSPGVTTWYSSHSLGTINAPPSDLNPGIGDLYIHTNRAEDFQHIWLFALDRTWGKVTASEKVYHPVIADRVLSMRANGTPSWITAASYTTIRGRKEKTRTSD